MPNILDRVSELYPAVSKEVVRYSQYLAGSINKTYGIDIDDLLQEAAIELVKCAEMDRSRSSNFSAYSQVMVKNRFQSIVRSMRRASLLPDGSARLRSLDSPSNASGRRLIDTLPYNGSCLINRIESDHYVSTILSYLTPIHREVFCMYTGICEMGKMSPSLIGCHHGRSRKWAWNKYNEARSAVRYLIRIAQSLPGKFIWNREMVINLHRSSNLTPKDIARLLGGRMNNVLYRLRKEGITGKKPLLSRSELECLVASNNPLQIARRYGISERTVQRRVSAYGISFPLNWNSRGAYQSREFRKAKLGKAVAEKGLDLSHLTKGAMRRAGVEPVLHWYRRNLASDYKDAVVKLLEDLYPDYSIKRSPPSND
ncbi:MAG: sigma factor [Nanoarchaeota archaeon]